MKTYNLKLTAQQAELLDIALSVAAANPKGHTDGSKYRDLQKEVERQFEEQD
jgi:hypothetical protein